MTISGTGIGNSNFSLGTEWMGRKKGVEKPFIAGMTQKEKAKAPYSELAGLDGKICYRGAVFVCDDEKRVLSLGDIEDEKKVLTIPMEKGGCLKVNRSNIADLTNAMTMFSPEDIKRILNAIALDAKCKKTLEDIEETENQLYHSV